MNLLLLASIFTGFMTIVLGILSKLMGISLLHPLIKSPSSYFVVATTCFAIALIIDRFDTR